MPSTPVSGQITFDDILLLAEDQPGYVAPPNVGLKDLALHIRTYGQSIPPNYPINISFSDFRFSTIVNWSVSSIPETASQYYGNNDDGKITVTLELDTFKTGNSGLTDGKKAIAVSIPGATTQTIYTAETGFKSIKFGGGGGLFNSALYIVSVKDIVTNVTTTKTVWVGYA
jgi:hypothetical protein